MKRTALIALLLVTGGPAMAGNYEASNYGAGLGASMNPGDRPGGNPFSQLGKNQINNSPSPANWGGGGTSLWSSVRGWFSGPKTSLGQVNYSAGGYGIGIGGFDPESRGSGVKAW